MPITLDFRLSEAGKLRALRMRARRSGFTSKSPGNRSMIALRMMLAAPSPNSNASKKPTVAMSAMPMHAPIQSRAPRGALWSKRNVSSVPPRIAMASRRQAANIVRSGFRHAEIERHTAKLSCLRFESDLNSGLNNSGLNTLKIDSKLCLRDWQRSRVIYKRDAEGPDHCDDFCVVYLCARQRTTAPKCATVHAQP